MLSEEPDDRLVSIVALGHARENVKAMAHALEHMKRRVDPGLGKSTVSRNSRAEIEGTRPTDKKGRREFRPDLERCDIRICDRIVWADGREIAGLPFKNVTHQRVGRR